MAATIHTFKAAWPIMAGYVVLGLPCGLLGVAAGMDVWMVAAMSILFSVPTRSKSSRFVEKPSESVHELLGLRGGLPSAASTVESSTSAT